LVFGNRREKLQRIGDKTDYSPPNPLLPQSVVVFGRDDHGDF
jgi:hypothetical protein